MLLRLMSKGRGPPSMVCVCPWLPVLPVFVSATVVSFD